MRWRHDPIPSARIRALGQQLGVGEILAELLLRANVDTPTAARTFLDPRLADLADPFALTGLDGAVRRIDQALREGESVTVFGDYDVDGVTSTALLVSILRRLGAQPRYVVPRRLEEGYGLSREAIDRALDMGRPDLFIALDCGTNSVAEVAHLRQHGIDVIIVDHHRSRQAVPADCALINPHVHGDSCNGIRDLCTVGLVFKLAHGLLKVRREGGDVQAQAITLKEYLDLVALGTVADLVPLQQENRILASHGLRILGRTQRPGLLRLMDVAGMTPGEAPRPVDVSFRLGPRINACGRLADATVAVELLLSDDAWFCEDASGRLESFNRERQDIEKQITEQAFAMIDAGLADAAGIAVYHPEWHTGVVGVVASRLIRRYNRPCIVLGREGRMAKGSGRGLPQYNLVEILGRCADLLDSWGGHPMAVGVSLPAEKMGEFQAAFSAAVAAAPAAGAPEALLDIAAWIPLDAVRDRMVDEVERLHPFGQGNPEPIFGSRGVIFEVAPEIFKEQHFRFQLRTPTGRRISGVAWSMRDRLPPVGQPLDIAYQVQWNRFNGRKYVQLELQDWRLSEA